MALEALMHDAAEAYLGDVTRPLKSLLPDYKKIERGFETALRRWFDIPRDLAPEVVKADQIMLATEIRDLGLLIPRTAIFGGSIEPMDYRIIPVSPEQAFDCFLRRYSCLAS